MREEEKPSVARDGRQSSNYQTSQCSAWIPLVIIAQYLRGHISQEVDRQRATNLGHIRTALLCPRIPRGKARQRPKPLPERERRYVIRHGNGRLGRLRVFAATASSVLQLAPEEATMSHEPVAGSGGYPDKHRYGSHCHSVSLEGLGSLRWNLLK